MIINTVGGPAVWTILAVTLIGLLALDLGVFHRRPHAIKMGEALSFSIFWISTALLFNFFIYLHFGSEKALEFFTGYLIEKALSVDNIFVFVVLLSYFQVPQRHQHRVLFYGVLGAIVLRGLFILIGSALIQSFSWIIYLFGALLVYTGYKLFHEPEAKVDAENGYLYRFAKRFVPLTPNMHEGHFFIRENGRRLATPLFLVLVAIEASDVVFAMDSIPAIFAITSDPFIIFSSNIFAILGLRALYFLLASAMQRLSLLRIGLALILVFIGLKMLVHGVYVIPTLWSLAVIATILVVTVTLSLLKERRAPEQSPTL